MKPSSKAQAKARKFAKELHDITPALLERSGGVCEVRIIGACGTVKGIPHRHHKLQRNHPACMNTMENLIMVCPGCHDWIHAHGREARALGLLVSEPWDLPGYEPLPPRIPAPEPELGYGVQP
jgi:hypothetical protein